MAGVEAAQAGAKEGGRVIDRALLALARPLAQRVTPSAGGTAGAARVIGCGEKSFTRIC